MNQNIISIFIGLTILAIAYSAECPNLKLPQGVSKKKFTGTWYAVRGIEHNEEDKDRKTGNKKTESCPKVTISTKKNNIWEFRWEYEDKPERKLKLKMNSEKFGLLESTKENDSNYRSVQIIKLSETDDVWGITMCSGGRVATAILSKERKPNITAVTSLTESISSQGLSVKNLYDRCQK